MAKVARSVLVGVAIAISLSGCQSCLDDDKKSPPSTENKGSTAASGPSHLRANISMPYTAVPSSLAPPPAPVEAGGR